MKIKPSNTTNSSIVAMGARLQKAMTESGEEYLMLNRGVNSVVNIDLKPVIENIDFMYATNGINTFAQVLVSNLLTSSEGVKSVVFTNIQEFWCRIPMKSLYLSFALYYN